MQGQYLNMAFKIQNTWFLYNVPAFGLFVRHTNTLFSDQEMNNKFN